jgi:hypothetical protein
VNADLVLTSLIQGDPLVAGPGVDTPAEVLGAVGSAPGLGGGALTLAPGVALVHGLTASAAA